MDGNTGATTIPVTLYFDYNCPFCYVGSHRLEQLAADYPLDILWRFVEIHPENDPAGQSLDALGYPPERWQAMTRSLERMVAAEGLPWRQRRFTTNTRAAMLLAQATLLQRPAAFLPLHRAIFHAYFADGENIGDREVLRHLAEARGVADLTGFAWETEEPIKVLLSHVEAARELGLGGVPTLVVAGRPFSGAVSTDLLRQALARENLT